MIKDLHEKEGMTVILVSHSMEDMARLATRLLVMADGKLVADGLPREIFSKPGLLTSIGLDVPEAAKLCEVLRAKGYNLPSDLYRMEELQEALLRLWKEGAAC
jgi:energy-coupling factor transport system ATP-binding protein